jgi:hypothetical protein
VKGIWGDYNLQLEPWTAPTESGENKDPVGNTTSDEEPPPEDTAEGTVDTQDLLQTQSENEGGQSNPNTNNTDRQ